MVSDINYPMALGGLTDGVTNLELTVAYATIANKGVYTEPIYIRKYLITMVMSYLKNNLKRNR